MEPNDAAANDATREYLDACSELRHTIDKLDDALRAYAPQHDARPFDATRKRLDDELLANVPPPHTAAQAAREPS